MDLHHKHSTCIRTIPWPAVSRSSGLLLGKHHYCELRPKGVEGIDPLSSLGSQPHPIMVACQWNRSSGELGPAVKKTDLIIWL